jgi:hypothetical protein
MELVAAQVDRVAQVLLALLYQLQVEAVAGVASMVLMERELFQ